MSRSEAIDRITELLSENCAVSAVWGGNGGSGYELLQIDNEERLGQFRRELLEADYNDLDFDLFKDNEARPDILFSDFPETDFINYCYAAEFRWKDGLVLQVLYW